MISRNKLIEVAIIEIKKCGLKASFKYGIKKQFYGK
jgi:hypothetical protein